MGKTVQIDYAGMRGYGKTVTAAKEDAARRAGCALSGDFQPRVIYFRGSVAVLWREPGTEGALWCYTILRADDLLKQSAAPEKTHGFRMFTSYPTFDAAERHARSHLAQDAWNGGETESPVILDAHDKKDFGHWAGWQIRYRAWRDAGANEDEAHDKAMHGLMPVEVREVACA